MVIANWKPSRTDRRRAQQQKQRARKTTEAAAKAEVRRRDRFCRFPLCGCRSLGMAAAAHSEASHHTHKGMGGNPSGNRSTADRMILLCRHRHQDGRVSIHKGTLRILPMTRAGMNGPVVFMIDVTAAGQAPSVRAKWRVVARESRVGVLAPLARWQQALLERLATMTR